MESFEQKIKERNNLLKSQVESLTGRNELVEVVDTLLKAGVAEEDLVEKAKYIRKESDGKGGYKYIYEEPKEHSGSTQSGYGEYLPKSKDVKKELEEFDNKLSDKDKKDISDAINKFKQSGGVFGSAEDVLKFKQKFIKEKKTDKVDKNVPKIGDKIKVEGKKPGFFVSAKITGIKGDMIAYETSDGDFGNINRNNSEKK